MAAVEAASRIYAGNAAAGRGTGGTGLMLADAHSIETYIRNGRYGGW